MTTRPRPVRWLQDHPVAADAWLAGGLAAMSLAIHLAVHDPQFAPASALGALLSVAGMVPLAWRRRSPEVVLGVMLLVQLVLVMQNWIGAGWVGVLVAAYSVGTLRSGRRLWWVGAITSTCVTGIVIAGVVANEVQWQSILTTPVLFAAAITLGDNVHRRRERAAELVERAERAERERELLATQQVQLERTRIARELHDVVAHSVSVMIIQAGAARRQIDAHPEHAREALATIESTGREAMSEMRRVLGVLRGDDPIAERAPQPSLVSLTDLVGGSSDLPVELVVESSLPNLPTAVELSAYRVVQEALTNIRRHAGRVDHVRVDVAHRDGMLVVEVIDDGRGAGHVAPSAQADGYGLLGMRERVELFGGEMRAGPGPSGGWRVHATFPLALPEVTS